MDDQTGNLIEGEAKAGWQAKYLVVTIVTWRDVCHTTCVASWIDTHARTHIQVQADRCVVLYSPSSCLPVPYCDLISKTLSQDQ